MSGKFIYKLRLTKKRYFQICACAFFFDVLFSYYFSLYFIAQEKLLYGILSKE